MAPVPLAAAGALAGAAYLNARFSLAHDLLFFRILGSSLFSLFRAQRADKINAFYVLEQQALDKTTGGKPFILFEGRSFTYAETYETVLRYGAWLRERHGVRERDVVALDYQNSETFVFFWFALWAVGAKPAFINHHLQGAALTHCLRESTAKLAVVDPRVAESVTEEVRRELSGMRFVVFTPEVEAEAREQEPVRYPDAVRSEGEPTDMAILIYTSGTTGMPKPAVVSWAKGYMAANISAKGTDAGQTDVIYTCMPLYHSAASCLAVCSALFIGATAAVGRRFSTKTFWKEVRDTNATVIQYVGETCRYLTVAPPETDPVTGENLDKKHCVRAAMGNGLRPDVWDRFKERFGIDTIYEIYAATEGAAGLWNVSRNSFGKGAIGRFGLLSGALSSLRSAIVRVDNETELPWRDPKSGLCQRVITGEAGEFIVRLPADDIKKGFQGYYGNASATNSKIMRDVFRKGDAWFRSGDVLQWDGDGRVYFNDRIGDTFRWKSENVSTAEVAQVLGLHPAVQEANVYGVQLPNHDGRAGCVAIVLDTPHANAQVLASLAAHAREKLPRYAVPLFLRLLREVGMQNTGTNKQQKQALRQQSVDPSNVRDDALFWLKEGTYVPFGQTDWNALEEGAVKL
ncbi:fatty acid transporter protein [Parachaetomium inaequale]|uniref:Very long-chain fatty acid transport protein n=1 Tax=Parachaetomium inaequale TaxID=2588326 RepID=A0AAN6PFA8_9PEZI|nr:fatty acid transporter protein [Parachaetomium inaequale]